MNYCLYKIRFIMERLVLVTVLIVASTIASPVVDVSNKQSKIIRIKFNNLADKKYRATIESKNILNFLKIFNIIS